MAPKYELTFELVTDRFTLRKVLSHLAIILYKSLSTNCNKRNLIEKCAHPRLTDVGLVLDFPTK